MEWLNEQILLTRVSSETLSSHQRPFSGSGSTPESDNTWTRKCTSPYQMTESSSQANTMLLLTSPIDWDAINVTLRFLGIVKNSEMTKPLHDQLAKNIFQWGTQQSRAFGAIKEAIVRGPILIGVCRCVVTITVEAGGGLQPKVCVYRSLTQTEEQLKSRRRH